MAVNDLVQMFFNYMDPNQYNQTLQIKHFTCFWQRRGSNYHLSYNVGHHEPHHLHFNDRVKLFDLMTNIWNEIQVYKFVWSSMELHIVFTKQKIINGRLETKHCSLAL